MDLVYSLSFAFPFVVYYVTRQGYGVCGVCTEVGISDVPPLYPDFIRYTSFMCLCGGFDSI